MRDNKTQWRMENLDITNSPSLPPLTQISVSKSESKAITHIKIPVTYDV